MLGLRTSKFLSREAFVKFMSSIGKVGTYSTATDALAQRHPTYLNFHAEKSLLQDLLCGSMFPMVVKDFLSLHTTCVFSYGSQTKIAPQSHQVRLVLGDLVSVQF
jgi:hypothetical protein